MKLLRTIAERGVRGRWRCPADPTGDGNAVADGGLSVGSRGATSLLPEGGGSTDADQKWGSH